MKYLSALLFILLVVSTEILPGQYYDTGQDPASLKWLQIKTSHFNIIYPEKYGSGGELYARSLEDAYSKLLAIFPERKFRIPVIIHNYTIQSNGYVAWAPKRMELYPSPEQNSIPLSPEKQLAIHELAHVFQMSSLHQGFTKILSVCLGEQISGIVAALLPAWFLEGDAVFAESALSESGRGRSPAFQKQLKALALEKDGLYKYDKILNGSYRDYVPDHYRFGYQMVTWALIKYKPDIWNNVLNYTAQSPVTGNPVNMSLRMSSGLTKKKLYRETFDTLTKIWTKELSTNGSAPYSAVNPVKKDTYTNYYSPVATGTDSIVAIRTSLSSPPAIVLIVPSKGKEKKMLTAGQIYPFDLSYGHGKILWVETESDPRWENRSYSVIRLLDISNGRVKRLTHKTRYLSVTISPDGKTIAAAENSAENINRLVTIDAATGAITGSVPSPDNVSMQRPRWAADGKKIVMIFLNNEGEGIMTYSPGKRKWEILSAAGRDDLQSAVLRNDSLWFVSSHSGTDNVYLKTHDGKVTRITHSRFGCSDLSQTGNKLIFSDYTSSGNDICLVSDIESNGSNNDKTFSESLLINRLAVNQDQKSDTCKKSTQLSPIKNGSIFSISTAGCPFMPILPGSNPIRHQFGQVLQQ